MRNFSRCLFILTFASVHLAEAQQAARVPVIGWLSARAASSVPGLEQFRQELGRLGYVEGKNIAFESRYAENQFDRLPTLADELIRLRVDVLLAPSTIEAVAAKNATRNIPIVVVSAADPVAAGLIDSLPRPGGNITGVTNLSAVLAGKQLELLKETVPTLSRISIMWDPKAPGSVQQWKESQMPARELGVQLHSMEISSLNDFENGFKLATTARSTALAVTQSPPYFSNRQLIPQLATQYRLPAIYNRREWVDSGGLMSYGSNLAEPYRRVASMVDKILKGTKPADLPVEQPTKFEFVINLKAAKQIGLTIPPSVVARADRVLR